MHGILFILFMKIWFLASLFFLNHPMNFFQSSQNPIEESVEEEDENEEENDDISYIPLIEQEEES